jgi:hypothetical protein
VIPLFNPYFPENRLFDVFALFEMNQAFNTNTVLFGKSLDGLVFVLADSFD